MGRFDKSKYEEQMIIKYIGLEQLTENGNEFNFRCPICGDSKKEKSKKRGYFYLTNKNTYAYKCHNCGVSYGSLSYFLKENFPNEYTKHYFEDNDFKNYKPQVAPPPKKVKLSKIDKHFNELLKYGNVIPCSKFKLTDESDDLERKTYKKMNEFFEKRKIPKDVISRLYISFNFYFDIFAIYKTMTDDERKFAPIEEDVRIFWKVKDINKKTIGFIGRSLEKDPYLRYMFSRVDEGVELISNIENIDITKPVFVTEGYFDSVFLDNSVSLNGVSSWKKKLLLLQKIGVKEVIMVLDNEDGMDKYHEEISSNFWGDDFIVRAVKFDKELRSIGKDINEYVINGLDLDKIVYSRVLKDYFDIFDDNPKFIRNKFNNKIMKVVDIIEKTIIPKIKKVSKEWFENMWNSTEDIKPETIKKTMIIDGKIVNCEDYKEVSRNNIKKLVEKTGFIKQKYRGRYRRAR